MYQKFQFRSLLIPWEKKRRILREQSHSIISSFIIHSIQPLECMYVNVYVYVCMYFDGRVELGIMLFYARLCHKEFNSSGQNYCFPRHSWQTDTRQQPHPQKVYSENAFKSCLMPCFTPFYSFYPFYPFHPFLSILFICHVLFYIYICVFTIYDVV